jgi:3-phenylpropionate/trans-cinnamate dioxygenase ferredoxin subunit
VVSRLEAPLPGEYRLSQPGTMLRCPWHCWEFDIRTGQSWCDPTGLKAKCYAANREPGVALAKGPYVAESFPVSVEEDYVVVEV